MGAGWGYGCTYVCDDAWGEIYTRIDDFDDYARKHLNASFVEVESGLKVSYFRTPSSACVPVLTHLRRFCR